MIAMNPYKELWMAKQNAFVTRYVVSKAMASSRPEGRNSRKPGTLSKVQIREPDVIDSIVHTATGSAVTWALPRIMKHLAQNQIKGKIGIAGRTLGRVGGRFVPIIGTAMLIKDAHSVLTYLLDD